MKIGAYIMRDIALDTYNSPMFFRSRGQAMRTFSDEVNRVSDDNLLHRHPEHYQLFYIGLFDDESGLFEPVPPEFITAGLDVLIDRSMI